MSTADKHNTKQIKQKHIIKTQICSYYLVISLHDIIATTFYMKKKILRKKSKHCVKNPACYEAIFINTHYIPVIAWHLWNAVIPMFISLFLCDKFAVEHEFLTSLKQYLLNTVSSLKFLLLCFSSGLRVFSLTESAACSKWGAHTAKKKVKWKSLWLKRTHLDSRFQTSQRQFSTLSKHSERLWRTVALVQNGSKVDICFTNVSKTLDRRGIAQLVMHPSFG